MKDEMVKIQFIPGLREIVEKELASHPEFEIVEVATSVAYLNMQSSDIFKTTNLRSITNAYLVKQDKKYNPLHISNHKSILGNMIEKVIKNNSNQFKTFSLSCAGSDSSEAKSIKNFIQKEYNLSESDDPDLKVFIGKQENQIWEIGAELTRRPLSLRDYKVLNIEGAMNPTIAYALNSLCELGAKSSYLNPCSGSATLLIEAALSNPRLKLVGFDHDKKKISAAIQNIKKAGFIKTITLEFADLFENPDLGTYDVITSDLPFGMHISKGDDLQKLYEAFIDYADGVLAKNGILAAYTTERVTFENALQKSSFNIRKEFELRIITNVNSYIYPKIYICERRNAK